MASEIGEYLPAGIDEGMKDAMPALLSSAEDQMGNLVDTVKDGAAEANGAIAGSGMPLLLKFRARSISWTVWMMF